MKLVVTIYEETFDAALGAIRALNADHDMVELRAERFGAIDHQALRNATAKPVILTYRGGSVPDPDAAIAAGIDFIDVEWHEGLRIDIPRERVVLSHHDYESMPDVESLLAQMRALGCAHTKLAVTPKTLDDNLRLLRAIDRGISVIGMGEQGLYSRILAPFRGSELTFVAATNSAAPGQLTLDRALQIYGSDRESLHATHVFAIAGNPAGHSLSPAIHNPLFREKEADAAYTIASFASFEQIVSAFEAGEIRGLSITAPFKEEAFAWAERARAHVRHNARDAGSVNTLVTMRDGCVVADNTDVDGFAALIGDARSVAIVGAGGTARAALVALKRAGAKARVFNRSQRPFPQSIESLDALRQFDGDLVINTLPHGAEVELPDGIRTIEAKYNGTSGSGFDLLRAQAVRQNELFVEAIS
ncbi:MAG TPA: type I 3-dehydroquinate dehydratase [Thermoanaerobaculia bacterium]|jgi:3-dehydroquinate dehydratase type I